MVQYFLEREQFHGLLTVTGRLVREPPSVIRLIDILTILTTALHRQLKLFLALINQRLIQEV